MRPCSNLQKYIDRTSGLRCVVTTLLLVLAASAQQPNLVLRGTVKGDQVDFTFEAPNVDGKVHYKETLEGATRMKGECEYGDLGKGTFTATKK